MGGNISKTQEEGKLTWSVRATEGTGTCGGKTRQKQHRGQLEEDREKKRTQGALRNELNVCFVLRTVLQLFASVKHLNIHCILAQIK